MAAIITEKDKKISFKPIPTTKTSHTPKNHSIIKLKEVEIELDRTQLLAFIIDNNLDTKVNESTIEELFKENDKENTGKVNKYDILEYYSKNRPSQEIESRADIAIKKLKKLRKKLVKQQDSQSIEDINWIISSILLNKWDDPEEFQSEGQEADAYKLYSQAQDSISKTIDIKRITHNSFKFSKVSNYTNSVKNRDNVSEISYKTNNLQGNEETLKHKRLHEARKSIISSTTEFLGAAKKLHKASNDGNENIISLNNNLITESIVENSTKQIINCNDSLKVNLGEERRSTINSVAPKIANEIIKCLNKVEEFSFNIFELDELVKTNSLLYISNEIFSMLNFYEDVINELKFRKFVSTISEGYSRNASYHNDLHAADVLQTTFILIEKGNIYYRCSLIEIDYIAILLSAICHDFRHPGIGNPYIINSGHVIALNFNGKNLSINFIYYNYFIRHFSIRKLSCSRKL